MVWDFDLNELPLDEDEAFETSSANMHDGQAISNVNQTLQSQAVASFVMTDSRVTWDDGDTATASFPSGSSSSEENSCGSLESQPTTDGIIKGMDKIGHDEDRALDSTTSDTQENREPNPAIDSQDTKNEVASLSSRNSDESASNLRRNREVLASFDEEKENHKDKEVRLSTGNNTLAKRIKKEVLERNSNFASRTYRKSAPAHRYASAAHQRAPPRGYGPAYHIAPPPSWNKYPGFVLKCNTSTKREFCARHCIYGMSASQSKTMEGIKPDTLLFLFDYELDLLNGIYVATSDAGFILERNGFGGRYSTQVRFEMYMDCYPLPLKTLKDLKERSNRWRSRDFLGEGLSKREVDHLSCLFSPRPVPYLLPHSSQPFTAADWVKIAAERPDYSHKSSRTGVSFARARPTPYGG